MQLTELTVITESILKSNVPWWGVEEREREREREELRESKMGVGGGSTCDFT